MSSNASSSQGSRIPSTAFSRPRASACRKSKDSCPTAPPPSSRLPLIFWACLPLWLKKMIASCRDKPTRFAEESGTDKAWEVWLPVTAGTLQRKKNTKSRTTNFESSRAKEKRRGLSMMTIVWPGWVNLVWSNSNTSISQKMATNRNFYRITSEK